MVSSVVAVTPVGRVVSVLAAHDAKGEMFPVAVVVARVGWAEGGFVGRGFGALVCVGLAGSDEGWRVVGAVAGLKLVADGVVGASPVAVSVAGPAEGRVAVLPVLAGAVVPAENVLCLPCFCCLLVAGSPCCCLAVVVLFVPAVESEPVVCCA